MINAEKLLGGLLRQSLGGGRRSRRRRKRKRSSGIGGTLTRALTGRGVAGAAGMGILTIAVAAYEHFSQKRSAPPAPAVGGAGTTPPPPPTAQATPPPPPPAAEAESAQDLAAQKQQETAKLLIQAMIAAASADGRIDPDEEREILEKLDQAGMTLEEREFILKQMGSPPSLESLLARVDSPDVAKQVYTVSLLAINIDTEAEEAYLENLRRRLNIDPATAKQLEDELGDAED